MLHQVTTEEIEKFHPSLELVIELVMNMDAKHRSLITLQPTEALDCYLTIGGGAGRYIACATLDNSCFYNAINPNSEEGDVDLVVGGQQDVIPTKLIITLEQAILVCDRYWRDHSLHESIVWQLQNEE